jgi:hypothetical protein
MKGTFPYILIYFPMKKSICDSLKRWPCTLGTKTDTYRNNKLINDIMLMYSYRRVGNLKQKGHLGDAGRNWNIRIKINCNLWIQSIRELARFSWHRMRWNKTFVKTKWGYDPTESYNLLTSKVNNAVYFGVSVRYFIRTIKYAEKEYTYIIMYLKIKLEYNPSHITEKSNTRMATAQYPI